MRRSVEKGDVAEIAKLYPISGVVEGWFFRATETSNCAWLVEGVDLWGRKVRRDGDDPDELLALCAEDAKRIIAEANAT